MIQKLNFTRMTAPLRIRDFRLLWIGQTISALGNPFQTIAVTWLVLLQLKGSPLDLALALLALSIPRIPLTLAGGIITDRLGRHHASIRRRGTHLPASKR